MRREARHAVVLLILVALLGLGFFFPAPLSLSEEAGYHESRREEVEFAQWMTYLTEGRTRSDAAAQRTSMKPLPQLCDAVDNRTTATADFYDGLQLQRVPGPHAQLEARHADLMERLDHCRHSTPTFSPSSVNHNYEGIRQWVPMQHLNGASVERVRFRPSSLTPHVDEPLHNGITRIDYSYLNALDSTLLTPDVRLYDLPRRRATIAPRHGWKTFFVALNLYRNEVLLPYLTGALVAFLEDEVAPFANLSTSVVVSIFSNVGPDRTAQLIREFLIPHLRRIGVTEIYATTTGSCLGYLSRQPFHDRIEWMGCVRNKALQPLLTHGMQVFGDAKADQDRMAILFFNDVYFRPQDITTLLESRMEPEIASRTQPDGLLGPAVKQGGRVEGGASGTTFDLACGMDFYHTFYDRWVSRDRHGQPFLGVFPYSDDVETRRSMRRLIERGAAASQAANEQEVKKSGHHYAVPVKCCWNGVAAMRGSFFLPKALHSTAEPHNTTTPLAAPTPNNATRSGPPTVPIGTPGATQYAALNTSEIIPSLDAMYTSLMLRRLLSMRIAWNKREAADAALHGRRPLPWRGSLNQLREEVQAAGRASPTYSCAQSLSFDSVMVPITNTSHDMLSCTSQHHATPLHSVPNHGTVFLKSTTPALRFRHSLVPSFGATAELRSLATVRPDVCLSSECLLICEDIAQVAMLREQRTPLILMNPNVKVAYESYHFDAVHRSWLYNAPWAFRLLTMVRRAERWSFGRSWNPLYLFVDAPDVREASARRTLGKDEGPEGEGGPEGGEDTTAADDWTWKNPGRRMELRLTGHRTAGSDAADGDANTLVGRFDVTRLSVMSCYLPADSRFTPYLVFLVRWITVGACVLLMWLLLWDVHRTIQVKRARWKSRQPAAEEEVIASGVGLTAIINESLSREEQWFLRLVELLRLPFTYLWLQACAWCPQLLQARGGRPERVVGGTDVKMALKRGGLLSWRGLRRRLAGWLHPGSGSPLRSPQRTASTETRWASTERPFSPLGGTRSRAGGRGPLTRGGSPREFPPV